MGKQPTYPFFEQPEYLLEPHEEGFFSELKEFKNKPEWLVKEIGMVNDDITLNWLKQFALDSPSSEIEAEVPKMTFERFRDEVGYHKKIVDGTATALKSFIPKNHLVFGSNEYGNERGFIIIQRVTGEDLVVLNRITSEMNSSFETFMLTSFDFYEEQKKVGVGYFPDIVSHPAEEKDENRHIHNLMYGNIGGGEKQIFLVDTYPLIAVTGDDSPYFDKLKVALEDYYFKAGAEPSKEIKARLIRYGSVIS